VHLIGAVIGTILVIVLVAGVNSTAAELTDRLAALSASLDRFGLDLIVRQVRSPETSAFLLLTGCIAWATGAYAAFAVFRRHRPMDALVVLGLLLLLNLSLTYESLFAHLVIFAAAGLLLLVRANLDEQRSGWARRRIGDAGHVSGLFMRSGLTFVVVAIVGAVLLTSVASSNPLAGFWRSYQGDLAGIGQQLNRWVGGLTAPARGPNSLFSATQTIQSRWISDPAIAYLAKPSDGNGHYWRVGTYDQFDGTSWNQTERVLQRVEAGQKVLGVTTGEIIAEADRSEISVDVTAVQPSGDALLSPEAPYIVADRAVDVWLKGENGPFATASFSDGLNEGDRYTVSAMVRPSADPADLEAGLTKAKLRAAQQGYPSYVAPYGDPSLAILPGSVGEMTGQVAAQILAGLPSDRRDAYSIAEATEAFLRDPNNGFRYDTDLTGVCDSGQTVDCFLRVRRGFCQQFATAMVMLLRENSVPARLAVGYLPGQRQADGTWAIGRSAAHDWVEVYFPGYGWVQFDPTPTTGLGGTETGLLLPEGRQVPTTSPAPGASASPAGRSFEPDQREFDNAGASTTPPTPGGPGAGWLAIVLVAVLIVGFAIAGYSVRERRKPTPGPDVVFRGVARLAGRFGYGPRPTQTAYEYADALGEVIPAARDELALVARVKVETQYARRSPSPDVLLSMRHAYRRIRVRLLALAFRRRRRRPR